MADALCGPSNPLQNLQKHTQVDRTLQQDRLVGPRQAPGQGFRTADPRAGSLDADFYAFENAAPSPFQHAPPEFANAFPTTAFSSPRPSLGPAGWAADFQRLNLHDQPVPAGQFRTEAPLVKSTIGGWQNEFMRQRSGMASPVAQGKQAVREPIQMNMNANASYMGYSSMAQQAYGSGMYQDGGLEQQQMPGMSMEQQQVPMSDVDFDAAFQEAVAHAQEMDQLRQQTIQVSETVAESAMTTDQMEPARKIGSDAIEYRERAERTEDQDSRDADELARTAGQLLTSVQHDTSDKFQNSQFLDLMRRIRDRQVEVANNDLQDVSTGHAATSTAASPDSMQPESQQPQAQGERESMHQQQQQQEPPSHFEFPDMDAVYAVGETSRHSPYTNHGLFDDGSGSVPAVAMQPRRQVDDIHPGGKWYPDLSPQMRTVPLASREDDDGGSLERRISASEFDYVDESAGLARRFS